MLSTNSPIHRSSSITHSSLVAHRSSLISFQFIFSRLPSYLHDRLCAPPCNATISRPPAVSSSCFSGVQIVSTIVCNFISLNYWNRCNTSGLTPSLNFLSYLTSFFCKFVDLFHILCVICCFLCRCALYIVVAVLLFGPRYHNCTKVLLSPIIIV